MAGGVAGHGDGFEFGDEDGGCFGGDGLEFAVGADDFFVLGFAGGFPEVDVLGIDPDFGVGEVGFVVGVEETAEVVAVGVGDQDGVDGSGVDTGGFEVFDQFAALAGVDEDGVLGVFDDEDVEAAGDFSVCGEFFQFLGVGVEDGGVETAFGVLNADEIEVADFRF